MARRRKSFIAVPIVLISVASIIIAYALPTSYRSTATLVMAAPISRDAIPVSITEYADGPIGSIRLKVLTFSNILSIIKANNLYGYNDDSVGLANKLVEKFRAATEIRLVESGVIGMIGRESQAEKAFTISFEYSDPVLSKDIAGQLANLFIEENDRARTEGPTKAAEFLSRESEKLENEIQDFDGRISEYKSKYRDSLPEHLQGNLVTLDRKESELRETEQRIEVAEQRSMFLAAELGRLPFDASGAVDNEAPMTDAEELAYLQAEYVKLSHKYLPSHPDVVRLARQIDALRKQIIGDSNESEKDKAARSLGDEGRESVASKTDGQSTDAKFNYRGGHKVSDNEGVSLKLGDQRNGGLQAFSPARMSLEAEYKSSQFDVRLLKEKKVLLSKEIEGFQNRLSLAPEVEKEYSELIRKRDLTLNKYNQLKEKLLDTRLVQTLEGEQHGQTMTLIEPPQIPEKPEKAIRRKVAISGVLFSIAIGFGSAFLADSLDPGIRGYRKLAEVTGLIPLVVIPYIEVPREIESRLARQGRWRLAASWALWTCLLLGTITLLALTYAFIYTGWTPPWKVTESVNFEANKK